VDGRRRARADAGARSRRQFAKWHRHCGQRPPDRAAIASRNESAVAPYGAIGFDAAVNQSAVRIVKRSCPHCDHVLVGDGPEWTCPKCGGGLVAGYGDLVAPVPFVVTTI